MNKITNFLMILAICLCSVTAITAQRRATPVNLKVTINDSVSQAGGIRSDGLFGGSYTNGVDSVSAQLTEYGWFNFTSGSREVTADYRSPVAVTQPVPVQSNTATGVNFKTFVTEWKMQDMTDGERQCVGAALSINLRDASQTVRTIAYRRNFADTAWVLVTRVDRNTWELEPIPTQEACAHDAQFNSVAKIFDRVTKGKTVPDKIYGSYFMPFKMTLTRQP